jgi:hypothetical protein
MLTDLVEHFGQESIVHYRAIIDIRGGEPGDVKRGTSG